MKMIEVAEHYIRLALEADKVVRKYKITTVGTGYDIVDIEELSAWNVASGTQSSCRTVTSAAPWPTWRSTFSKSRRRCSAPP
jgi:hypothetical protein